MSDLHMCGLDALLAAAEGPSHSETPLVTSSSVTDPLSLRVSDSSSSTTDKYRNSVWNCSASEKCTFQLHYSKYDGERWKELSSKHLESVHGEIQRPKRKFKETEAILEHVDSTSHAIAYTYSAIRNILRSGPHIVDSGEVPYFACPLCESTAVFWTPLSAISDLSTGWLCSAVSHIIEQHAMDKGGACAVITGLNDLILPCSGISITCGTKSNVGCGKKVPYEQTRPGPAGPNTLCATCSFQALLPQAPAAMGQNVLVCQNLLCQSPLAGGVLNYPRPGGPGTLCRECSSQWEVGTPIPVDVHPLPVEAAAPPTHQHQQTVSMSTSTSPALRKETLKPRLFGSKSAQSLRRRPQQQQQLNPVMSPQEWQLCNGCRTVYPKNVGWRCVPNPNEVNGVAVVCDTCASKRQKIHPTHTHTHTPNAMHMQMPVPMQMVMPGAHAGHGVGVGSSVGTVPTTPSPSMMNISLVPPYAFQGQMPNYDVNAMFSNLYKQ